jgi:hypothetical protein
MLDPNEHEAIYNVHLPTFWDTFATGFAFTCGALLALAFAWLLVWFTFARVIVAALRPFTP